GQISQLGDWTQNLLSLWPTMPDVWAIRAEHLARIGKHHEASSLLFQLPTVGLPTIADGLFYVTKRLRSYLPTTYESAKTKGWSSALQARIDIDIAKATFERLQPFAVASDLDRPVTTYGSIHPTKPNTELAPPYANTDSSVLDLQPVLGP